MADAIGPGDWVECIADGASKIGRSAKVGHIYRVRAFGGDGRCLFDDCADRALILDGAFHADDIGHCPHRFRPIYRPKQSIIEALKAPVTRTPQVVKPIREDA